MCACAHFHPPTYIWTATTHAWRSTKIYIYSIPHADSAGELESFCASCKLQSACFCLGEAGLVLTGDSSPQNKFCLRDNKFQRFPSFQTKGTSDGQIMLCPYDCLSNSRASVLIFDIVLLKVAPNKPSFLTSLTAMTAQDKFSIWSQQVTVSKTHTHTATNYLSVLSRSVFKTHTHSYAYLKCLMHKKRDTSVHYACIIPTTTH